MSLVLPSAFLPRNAEVRILGECTSPFRRGKDARVPQLRVPQRFSAFSPRNAEGRRTVQKTSAFLGKNAEERRGNRNKKDSLGVSRRFSAFMPRNAEGKIFLPTFLSVSRQKRREWPFLGVLALLV